MKTNYSIISILVSIFLAAFSNGLNAQSATPLIRLKIDAVNFNDETVFYFQQGGTPAFQSYFDAYKLVPHQGKQPYLGSMSDSVLTSISGLPALPVNLSIPVKAISPVTRTFTFSAEPTDFPSGVCVTLYDAFTGTSTKILTTSYVCSLYDTTTIARFRLNVSSPSTELSSTVKQSDCTSPNGGMITAEGMGGGPWNYEWSQGKNVVKQSINKIAPDTLLNLNGGTYSVKISRFGGCDYLTRTFTLDSSVTAKASFETDVFKTTLSNSGLVHFTNLSTGALLNSWDFGDNSGTWFIPSPSYNYKAEGVYTVTLISESSTHCKDTAQKVITVVNDATGIADFGRSGEVRLATLSHGSYELLFSLHKAADIEIEITDLKGSVVKSESLSNVGVANYNINLGANASGMYLLKISSEVSQKAFKLLN